MVRPKLTVGIPTFNRAEYLTQAIESALAQDFRDFDLVIADNASSDETQAICERFAGSDKRIRYMRQPINVGMLRNWKSIEELTETPYIKFLMDDDLLLPDALTAFHEASECHPHCAVFACLGSLFRDGIDFTSHDQRRYAPDVPVSGPLMLAFLARWFNPLGCPTNIMFRADALRQVSDFWLSWPTTWGPDYLACARALKHGDFFCINRSLVAVRVHAQSETAALRSREMQVAEEMVLVELSRLAPDGVSASFAHMHRARLALIRAVRSAINGNVGDSRFFLRRWFSSPYRGWALTYGLGGAVRTRLSAHSLPLAFSRELVARSSMYRDPRMERFWSQGLAPGQS